MGVKLSPVLLSLGDKSTSHFRLSKKNMSEQGLEQYTRKCDIDYLLSSLVGNHWDIQVKNKIKRHQYSFEESLYICLFYPCQQLHTCYFCRIFGWLAFCFVVAFIFNLPFIYFFPQCWELNTGFTHARQVLCHGATTTDLQASFKQAFLILPFNFCFKVINQQSFIYVYISKTSQSDKKEIQ